MAYNRDAFSSDAFSSDAFDGLAARPYIDLSGKQRVYVRTLLESVYTKTETEQIIATAARNSISVLDAAISLRVNVEPLQLVAAAARERRVTNIERQQIARTKPDAPKTARFVEAPVSAFASTPVSTVRCTHQSESIVSTSGTQTIVVTTEQDHTTT